VRLFSVFALATVAGCVKGWGHCPGRGIWQAPGLVTAYHYDGLESADEHMSGNSMNIIGIEGFTDEQIHLAVERGAKFVVFQYCISVVLMTFKRSSDVYFIRPGHPALAPRIGYSIISLLLGWWGFPWGPIYTVQALWNNALGGLDLTPEMLSGRISTAGSQMT